MCDCLSGDPIEGDPRNYYQHEWQTGMCSAPCASPGCFCLAFFCPCPSAAVVRHRVLGGNMEYYKCCQGYYDCACWSAGSLGESSCPDLCNALEACLCFGCHISSSRALVMDTRSIKPDPCDNRLVALNNCLVLLACICDILAMFIEELEPLSSLLDLIQELVTKIVSACMITQVNLEVTSAPRPIMWDKANQYPRGASKAAQQLRSGGGIPQQVQMGSVPRQQQNVGGIAQQQYGGSISQQQYVGGTPKQQYGGGSPGPQQQYAPAGGFPQQQFGPGGGMLQQQYGVGVPQQQYGVGMPQQAYGPGGGSQYGGGMPPQQYGTGMPQQMYGPPGGGMPQQQQQWGGTLQQQYGQQPYMAAQPRY